MSDICSDTKLPTGNSSAPVGRKKNQSTQRLTVAVLPFTNHSDDQSQEYFADGMTSDAITQLSKHRRLDLIDRNTSFSFKEKPVDAQQLGTELNARYVVDGDVQRSGDQIHTNIHLIDTDTGHRLWSECFDRDFSDLFMLQDEITSNIVARIDPETAFSERQQATQSRPTNIKTWECFHRGIYHLYRFTGKDNEVALCLLEQCHTLDNQFGEGYAWWAYASILGMVYWQTPASQEDLDKALKACDHALSLNHQNATFHAIRARILLARQEYSAAIAANEIAISLNPSFATAYFGLGDSMACEQRYDEALVYFNHAIALSPNDPKLWAFYTAGALALLFKGEYLEALNWAKRASNISNHQFWTIAHQAVALYHLGKVKEAELTASKLLNQAPQFSLSFAKQKLFYLREQNQINFYLASLKNLGIQ